jgi:hypothetical protein
MYALTAPHPRACMQGAFLATDEEVLEAARFVLFERVDYGFVDDLEYTCQVRRFDSCNYRSSTRSSITEQMKEAQVSSFEPSPIPQIIFTRFGWPWEGWDVAKLSRNINDRAKPAAILASNPASTTTAAATKNSMVVTGAEATAAASVEASAKTPKVEDNRISPFLSRIAQLNGRDVRLYADARRRYDTAKAAALAPARHAAPAHAASSKAAAATRAARRRPR